MSINYFEVTLLDTGKGKIGDQDVISYFYSNDCGNVLPSAYLSPNSRYTLEASIVTY